MNPYKYYNRIAQEYPKPETRGYLYIIVSPTFPEYAKVGKSVDLSNRIRTYNSYNPYHTFMFDFISTLFDDYNKAEEDVLNELKRRGIEPLFGNEWFSIEHKQLIKDLIQNLNQKHKRLLK